jgi:hypothetical protein
LLDILPREFVPKSTLQHALQHIKQEILNYGSGFQVTYDDLQHYYHIHDVAFRVKNDNLFIMMKIPISRITA